MQTSCADSVPLLHGVGVVPITDFVLPQQVWARILHRVPSPRWRRVPWKKGKEADLSQGSRHSITSQGWWCCHPAAKAHAPQLWGIKLPPLPGAPCPKASLGFPAGLTRCSGRSHTRCCTCCHRCHTLVSIPLSKPPRTSHPW